MEQQSPTDKLTDKALGRVTAKDSRLWARKPLLLPSGQRWNPRPRSTWASNQRRRRQGKNNEKTDTTDSETRQHVTISINVECANPWLAEWLAVMTVAVNDNNKATRHQLEELQRYDRAMEQDRVQGLYLTPHKYRRGLYLSPISVDRV